MDNSLLTIAICNYNTTALTNNLIKSIELHIKVNYKIIVLDNSDNEKFTTDFNCKILDNTTSKYIDFCSFTSILEKQKCAALRHTMSILFLIDICTTKHLLLLDSDVALINDLDFIDLNDTTNITIADCLHNWFSKNEKCEKYARFIPFIQLFNVELISKYGIKYFSFDHILHGIKDNSLHYDTGSYFYEKVRSKAITFLTINFAYYIKHLFSGSENLTDSTLFLMPQKKYDCIVSLTTWLPRFRELLVNLKSLLRQKTLYTYKIVLVLTENDMNMLPLDVKIVISQNNNIELIYADMNIKAHKKYFYTMLKYKTTPIITVDDDVKYDLYLVENLMNEYVNSDKNVIIAGRIHKITYTSMNISKYNNWNHDINTNCISHLNFATGVGGVLYPPNCLHITTEDLDDIVNVYLTNDDFFLKDRELKYDIKVKRLLCNKTYDMLQASLDTCALAYTNTQNKCFNDIAIGILQTRYKDKFYEIYEK